MSICKVKGLYTQVLWLYMVQMVQVPGTSSGSVLDQRRLRTHLWLVITTATTGL